MSDNTVKQIGDMAPVNIPHEKRGGWEEGPEEESRLGRGTDPSSFQNWSGTGASHARRQLYPTLPLSSKHLRHHLR